MKQQMNTNYTILVKLKSLNINKCINNNRDISCLITIINELDIKILVSIELTKHHNLYLKKFLMLSM